MSRLLIDVIVSANGNNTETYGFNTTRNAPQHATLVKFEEDLTHLISNL